MEDAIATYLGTVAATRAHKTWLAYNLILNTFRESCSKQHLDEIDKNDLTAFVGALKKDKQDDRTVANRVAGVVTFLRAHGIVNVTLRHTYTEKKVKTYSVEELRALNTASTDEELQIWQFFLGTGFREDEVAHAFLQRAREKYPEAKPRIISTTDHSSLPGISRNSFASQG